MALFQPAVKERLRARVAIDGPTGSGKTWTALQWARILAGPDGPVGVIDTENRSAAYYAPGPDEVAQRVNWWEPPYVFGHLPTSPPYDPRELRSLIQAAAEELGPDGVLVIDSLTHYWNGEGGTLDVVDNASSRGNSFTGWKEGTPAQRGMLDAIIHAPCHVIVTMRSKMEYLLVEENRGGRTVQVPTKVGMAPEQRSGVEYEFTVVADMDLEHRLVVSKSRCDAIADVVAPKGRSYEPAQTFAAWLATGVTRVSEDEVATLYELVKSVADEDEKASIKSAFQARFGPTRELTSDKYPAALAWLSAEVGAVPAGTDTPADPAPGPESDAGVPIPDDSDDAVPVDSTSGEPLDGGAAADAALDAALDAGADDVPPPLDDADDPAAARKAIADAKRAKAGLPASG